MWTHNTPHYPKIDWQFRHLACQNHFYPFQGLLSTANCWLRPRCIWYCHRTSENSTGVPFCSLWLCVQNLVQVDVNCLYCTSVPLKMFINGVWPWMISHQASLLANSTLYINFGSLNMYFQFLGALFWGDFGTYFWWWIMSCQQKSSRWNNVVASQSQV